MSSVETTSLVIEWSSQPNDVVEEYIVTYTGLFVDRESRNKTLNGMILSVTLEGLLSGETYSMTVTATSGSPGSGKTSAESAEQLKTTGMC